MFEDKLYHKPLPSGLGDAHGVKKGGIICSPELQKPRKTEIHNNCQQISTESQIQTFWYTRACQSIQGSCGFGGKIFASDFGSGLHW